MFTVRTIRAGQDRVETANLDLVPALEQGRRVCDLFAHFLASRPGEFRERLPFLNKAEIDLEWAAASGGAAFASFHSSEGPLAMGILLGAANAEADAGMSGAFAAIVEPMLGEATEAFLETAPRPSAHFVLFPGEPELLPAVELLISALASVYFRAVQAAAGQEPAPAAEAAGR